MKKGPEEKGEDKRKQKYLKEKWKEIKENSDGKTKTAPWVDRIVDGSYLSVIGSRDQVQQVDAVYKQEHQKYIASQPKEKSQDEPLPSHSHLLYSVVRCYTQRTWGYINIYTRW